jgi:hypothetical protein
VVTPKTDGKPFFHEFDGVLDNAPVFVRFDDHALRAESHSGGAVLDLTWAEVRGLRVWGPEEEQTTITMSRVVALGALAALFPKDVTVSYVEIDSDKTPIVLAVQGETATRLRELLTPVL